MASLVERLLGCETIPNPRRSIEEALSRGEITHRQVLIALAAMATIADLTSQEHGWECFFCSLNSADDTSTEHEQDCPVFEFMTEAALSAGAFPSDEEVLGEGDSRCR